MAGLTNWRRGGGKSRLINELLYHKPQQVMIATQPSLTNFFEVECRFNDVYLKNTRGILLSNYFLFWILELEAAEIATGRKLGRVGQALPVLQNIIALKLNL